MSSANQVFLHVGTMKSGTSYLQTVLRRNREALTEAGVFVPRRMVAAASDALGNKGGNRTMDIRGEWSRVVTEIGAWQGERVIASHEFLAAASAEQALSIIQSLAPHRITVVITARDLLRVIPSHWQTAIKGAKTWSFGDYVRYLLDDPGARGGPQRAHAGFWRHHDLARVVGAWGEAVGLANVVVITVPPPGASADLLWDRFADVVGLDGATYDHEPDAQSNVSMSYAETEMLRQINALVEPELSPFEYRSIVNNYFANELMRDGPHDDSEDRPRLGPASHARVAARSLTMVAAVRAAGVRVAGDLAELDIPHFTGDPNIDEMSGPKDAFPAVVPHVIAQLLVRLAHQERGPDGTPRTARGKRQNASDDHDDDPGDLP